MDLNINNNTFAISARSIIDCPVVLIGTMFNFRFHSSSYPERYVYEERDVSVVFAPDIELGVLVVGIRSDFTYMKNLRFPKKD